MRTTRRNFVLSTAAIPAAAQTAPVKGSVKPLPPAPPRPATQLGVSLALWSMNQSFWVGKWKLLDMPGIMKNQLGIEGIEYVNQFFENPTLNYLQKLRRACETNGIKSLLLMVDNEGATAAIDKAERKQAEIAHRKWLDIAHFLGCRYVRINMYGGLDNWREDAGLVKRAAETIRGLLDYSKDSGVEILVENHGRASSDPDNLVALVKAVNHPRFGLLVDLGNWNQGDDRYAAVAKTIPFGRALSVKGTYGARIDPGMDMVKLMETALAGGYKGWWSIEVSPRLDRSAPMPSPDELFELEIKTVREVKAIVDKVVFKKA
jgi:sugar phosphate isomerase/epimerase